MKKISIGLNVFLLLILALLLFRNNVARESVSDGGSRAVFYESTELSAESESEAMQSELPAEPTDEAASVPPWPPYLDNNLYAVPDFHLVDLPVRYNQRDLVLVIANNGGSINDVEYLFTDDRHYSIAHLSKAEVEDRIGQKLP